MASDRLPKRVSGMGVAVWVSLALSLLNIVVGRRWPGSLAATLASRAFIGFGTVWLVMRIRQGYLLRKPHWTRESWFRYLRLAAMPVAAVAVVLYFSSFDNMSDALGAPHTTTRMVWAIALTTLLIFGAIGLGVAVDWMVRGEPGQQFTRTRWFQRQRPNVAGQ